MQELFKLLLVGPLLFLIGPVFALSLAQGNPRSVTTGPTEEMMNLLFRINSQTNGEAFTLAYNSIFFILPFYVGLHVTYLDKNLFLRAVGDKLVVPSRWKTYTRTEISALAVLLVFLSFVTAIQLALLAIDGLLVWYLVSYVFVMMVVGLVSFLIRRTHELHVHHYLFGLFLLPLPRTFNPISSCTMAVSAGVFVEGVARWGMACLWDARN